jgi:hypothetical protein
LVRDLDRDKKFIRHMVRVGYKSLVYGSQVLQKFEEILTRHKYEVQGISNVEKGKLKKFLIEEDKKTTQLTCALTKVEEYIKRFSRELPTLKSLRRQYVFPHNDICKILFDQWEKYDKEIVSNQTPNSRLSL